MTSRLIKRLISGALALTLVFNINGFAAVVTDNDGSAFITKAEFDSLKNGFQAQIDSYNQAIDSKIDGAIAAYLAGIQIATTESRSVYNYSNKAILSMDMNNQFRYQLGYSYMVGVTGRNIFRPGMHSQNRMIDVSGHPEYWTGTNPRLYHKLLITHIIPATKNAQWVGYTKDAREQVSLGAIHETVDGYNFINQNNACPDKNAVELTTVVKADEQWTTGSCDTTFTSGYFHHGGYWLDATNTGYNCNFIVSNISTSYASTENSTLCILYDKKNYEFQDANINHGTNILLNAVALNTYWTNLKNDNSTSLLSEDEYVAWLTTCANGKMAFSQTVAAGYTTAYTSFSNTSTLGWKSKGSTAKFSPPTQCFESRGGIDSWSQLYNSAYDELGKYYAMEPEATWPNTLIKEVDDEGNESFHIALTAGIPLIRIKGEEKCSFKFNMKTTADLPTYLWLKVDPFDKTVAPANETDKSRFLVLKGNHGATFDNSSKALKVLNNDTTIEFEIPDTIDEGYVWMKWAKASVPSVNATGGGELILPENVKVVLANQ